MDGEYSRPCRKDQAAPIVVAMAAIGGAAVCGLLLAGHVGGWTATSEGTSFLLKLCGESAVASAVCADVINSRFGSFDFHLAGRWILVPTALIGLVYFTAVAFLFAFTIRLPLSDRWIKRPLFALVTCGLLGSLFFIAVMAVSLSTWCRLCVIAHLCNGVVFAGTAWSVYRSRRAPAFLHVGFQRRSALCAMTAAAVIGATVWLYFDASMEARRQWRKVRGYAGTIAELQADADFVLREYDAQPVVDLPWVSDPTGESAANVAPSVVIFADPTSSAGACFYEQWHGTLSGHFADGVNVTYANVFAPPVDDTDVPRQVAAVIAAGLQGGEDASAHMRGILLDSRRDARALDYERLACAVGLDAARFTADMEADSTRALALREVELARRFGVDTAPAAFLNGRRVPDLCLKSPVFWRQIADRWQAEQVSEAPQVASVLPSTE